MDGCKRSIYGIVLAFLLSAGPAMAQLQFTITDLGPTSEVEVTALDPTTDHSVGGRKIAGVQRAAILHGLGAGLIPDQPGSIRALASATLARRTVGYGYTSTGPVIGRGFRFDALAPPGSQLTLLPVLPGFIFSWARGIARAGLADERLIAVYSPPPGTGPYHPYWCDNISTCTPLATFGPGEATLPNAINHLLDIVGKCNTPTTILPGGTVKRGESHACWWPLSTSYAVEDLHPPGSFFFSSAWDINVAQDMVISVLRKTTVGTSFLRRASGVYEELPPLPGDAVSVALALNDAGVPVGHSAPPSPGGEDAPPKTILTTTAILWEGTTHTPVALLSRCTNCVADGWTGLERAVDINNSNLIVGWGKKGGVKSAYLLTPVPPPPGPEPAKKLPTPEPEKKPRWPGLR